MKDYVTEECSIQKSWKNRFPFNVAATSFVYPADYLYNVKRLSSLVDEIELLFFESENPPDGLLVQSLKDELAKNGTRCNIHLPIDVSITDPDSKKRMKAVRTMQRFIHQTSELNPTTFTLHIPWWQTDLDVWRQTVKESLTALFSEDISPAVVSIENTDYPFEWVLDIIDEFKANICADTGHMILNGVTLDYFFRVVNMEKVQILHLHGVDGKKDHQPVNCLSDEDSMAVINFLRSFTGTLSLEVFSIQKLVSSLETLDQWWKDSSLTL